MCGLARLDTCYHEWRDINKNPLDLILTFSASVNGIKGLDEFAEFSGAIQGVKVDLGRLFKFYLSQIVLNGQVGFKLSSDGKFYAEGKLNFLADMITLSVKMYGNISKIFLGSASVLLLAEAPTQLPVLTLYAG